jgi:hypothetical protein
VSSPSLVREMGGRCIAMLVPYQLDGCHLVEQGAAALLNLFFYLTLITE